MIHQVCPNPELLQQLYTGPLGAHVDTFAQQMLDQGYASSTAQYAMRVLAAFSTWLQRQDLTATDLNEQQVEDFLHDHPWRTSFQSIKINVFQNILDMD
jgi:site-specific recombinase XerD